MEVVAIVDGEVLVWKPLPGLDPSLGERALQIGAMAYGTAKNAGKPEAVAQQEAEKEVYKAVFRVKY
jgi:hypothetical protein